jgi:superfamily II DNA or RNA helicase
VWNLQDIHKTLAGLKCRQYQSNYVLGNFRGWLDYSTGLNVAATGAGKTWIGASAIRCWIEHCQGKVLWIAHRRELNKQAIASIKAITGHEPELEMGESRVDSNNLFESSPVVVASIQSLMAGTQCKECGGLGVFKSEDPMKEDSQCPNCIGGKVRRLQKFTPDEFGLIITDEGHRSAAESYRRSYRWFGKNPNSRFLMLTATPSRGDEQSLGELCDFVVDVHGDPQTGKAAEQAEICDIRWCIEEGWLVPVVQKFIECTSIDLRSVGTRQGELATGDLESVMLNEQTLHEMVAGTIKFTGDKKTVIFCVDRAHAKAVTEMLNREGYKPGSARMVTGETEEKEREDIISGHKEKEFQYLVNVDIVTEGYDDPAIECVVMMRPRKTKGPYLQCIGRSTRPLSPPTQQTALERKAAIASSAKPHAEIIDFCGQNGKHKLITTLDIMGQGDIRQDVLDENETTDELLKRAQAELEKEAQEQREREEAAKRAKLAAKRAEFRVTTADPFAWIDVVDTKHAQPGDRECSLAQSEALERFGLSPTELAGMTHRKAQLLLKTLTERRNKGLCTYKQSKMLSKRGIDTKNLTKKQASDAIDILINHTGWKVTPEVLRACGQAQ